jgi:hypothetical protein
MSSASGWGGFRGRPFRNRWVCGRRWACTASKGYPGGMGRGASAEPAGRSRSALFVLASAPCSSTSATLTSAGRSRHRRDGERQPARAGLAYDAERHHHGQLRRRHGTIGGRPPTPGAAVVAWRDFRRPLVDRQPWGSSRRRGSHSRSSVMTRCRRAFRSRVRVCSRLFHASRAPVRPTA